MKVKALHDIFDVYEGEIYEATIDEDGDVWVIDDVGDKFLMLDGDYEVVEQ